MSLVQIDLEKCNRDGVCIAECPAQVLREDTEGNHPVPTEDFETNCLQCGHCVAVCPTEAFSLAWLSSADCPPLEGDLRLSPAQAEQFLRSRRSIRIFRNAPIIEWR